MRERSAKAAVSAASEDGRVSLALGGFLQARAERELIVARAGDGGEDVGVMPIFSLPRMRLYTFGHVHDESVRYRLMVGATGVAGPVQVLDAYVEKRIDPALELRAGVFKIPVYRAWIESARLLASAGRASSTTAFIPGREAALMASGEVVGVALQYAIAVVNGAAPGVTSSEPAGAARAVWNPMGRVIEGEIDFEDLPPTLSFGASVLVNRRVGQASSAPSTPSLASTENASGVEVAFRAYGVDVSGECMVRERRRDDGERAELLGAYVRVDSYVAALASSFGVRASVLSGRRDATLDRRDLELDYGFYPGRHDLKVNVEARLVTYAHASAFEGVAQAQVAF